MKTLSTLKLKIMVRAFKIRIKNGEVFEDIAADYPALTTDDLEAIRETLNFEQERKYEKNQSRAKKALFILRKIAPAQLPEKGKEEKKWKQSYQPASVQL